MSIQVDVKIDAQLAVRTLRQAERAMALGGEVIRTGAVELAPKDKGHLRGSAQVQTNGLEAKISFNTPYAARQHEETTWRHQQGRAKFLEVAAERLAQPAITVVANAIANS